MMAANTARTASRLCVEMYFEAPSWCKVREGMLSDAADATNPIPTKARKETNGARKVRSVGGGCEATKSCEVARVAAAAAIGTGFNLGLMTITLSARAVRMGI